jgi:hypothetical protein
MTTTLEQLFAVCPENRKATRKPRKAQPVTIITPEGDRKPARPTKADHLAESFRAWATAVGNYDEATLRLISVLVNNDSISARKASDIATEALGANRGWSKNKITALRWTAPIWALAVADATDRPVDDDDAPITVDALVAEVRTLCDRLGSARVASALAGVDEPSVVAYVTALRDALVAKDAGEPVDAVDGDEDAEAEAEGKPGKTDADRIQAVLNTLSGVEFDETLIDALPALVDRVAEIVAKATAEATV